MMSEAGETFNKCKQCKQLQVTYIKPRSLIASSICDAILMKSNVSMTDRKVSSIVNCDPLLHTWTT
jgi:hypothetical protein